ncbi:hypothetical protein V5O48_006208 [Marasmius crinis-equi]|uniref:Peroxidase n=1 Tax=Marasmius crinis-equi TaxID=585013 RepID=A0ABR3FK41_9AGAR
MHLSRVVSKWACFVSYAHLSIAAIHWPDLRMERLEEQLWGDGGIPLIPGRCTPRNNSTISAEWVRLAYHDMATHNIEDGTGGLDASIAFELDRAQNVGVGMTASVNDFLPFTDPGVSLADAIALGTVLGVASCGGPFIPFRGGRVDATSAGPATVPEPQQDLASHTESFRRQGFTQSEMIGLVACGHSLGGVRRDDFPEIIQESIEGTNVALFDGTQGFDNTVLASPDNFNKICVDLLERMINTVPQGVQLTDVVEPIQYKVGQSALFPTNDGFLRFTTSLRVIGLNSPTIVTLFYTDRQASACPTTGCSTSPSGTLVSRGSFMSIKRGLSGYTTFEFDAKINASTPISRFWFEVDEGDGSGPVLVDNDGAGLLITQDTILFDRARSSFVTGGLQNVVVAVRTDDPSTKVSLLTYTAGTQASPTPKRETVDLPVDSRFPPMAGYTFFSGNFPSSLQWVDIAAEVGGETIRETNVRLNILLG